MSSLGEVLEEAGPENGIWFKSNPCQSHNGALHSGKHPASYALYLDSFFFKIRSFLL